MTLTPDKVFARMERRRAASAPRAGKTEVRAQPAERRAAYQPRGVRTGVYEQLMKSHDRMSERHMG